MTELIKPSSESELPRPFNKIGDDSWAIRVRDTLKRYEAPMPMPVTNIELRASEQRLGVRLPANYRTMLTELGPLHIDGFDFFEPSMLNMPVDFSFKKLLRSSECEELSQCIAIAEYASRDVFVMNVLSSGCALLRHDPPSLDECLPSLDDLIKVVMLTLPSSCYGWPDDDVYELVSRAQKNEFGTNL